MNQSEIIQQGDSRSIEFTKIRLGVNKSKGNARRIIRALHRDIGYFCVGMTIVFAISGLAVNHIDDWNPNYEVSRLTKSIEILPQLKESEQLNSILLKQLELDIELRAEFWESENRYKLFAQKDMTIDVDFSKQLAVIESVKPRPVLSLFNRLHLNDAHKAWVIFSDIFAVLLLFLAISSFFMLKGKKGVQGPKGLWVLAGLMVPGIFFFI
ncbi:PepSY-associated TM helix domain-containing protein [Aliikangiella sp. G2MR2-5]|uniref:PepSY-associated TM helix domain-containing protein n=1 Tax=Aliikangiella sp. G2MR2-5 TaxID=2788943 RepID=UPI0018AA1B53|nr:PepSY-associated TM helix domain-containing protein [Aliikangiella sp. G2MR2-5]